MQIEPRKCRDCGADAVVRYHGFRCAACAGSMFGAVVGFLSKIEMRDVPPSKRRASLPDARLGGPSSGGPPSSGGGGVRGTYPSPGAVPPVSVEELEELLALDVAGGPGWVEAVDG